MSSLSETANEIEVEGGTLEEARLRAEGRLGALAEEIEFTVLQEGKPGVFGFFARPWRLRAKVRSSVGERAAELVRQFFAELGVAVQPEIRRAEDRLLVDVQGDFDWFLRRRGEALDALQYIVGAAVGRRGGERIIVDVGGYRAARQRALETLARQVAERVLQGGEAEVLEAMPASERRIVHGIIQEYGELESQSRGEDPHRQVVIRHK